MSRLTPCVIVLGLSGLALTTAADLQGTQSIDISGTWKAIGLVDAGKKIPGDVVEKSKQVITYQGDKYSEASMGKVSESGTYKIDGSKTPVTIDLIITEGEEKGKKQLGLIKLDGDVLIMALAKYGSTERPKSFEGNDARWVLTLKRSK